MIEVDGLTRIFRRDATKLGPVAPLEPGTPVVVDNHLTLLEMHKEVVSVEDLFNTARLIAAFVRQLGSHTDFTPR